MAAMFEDFRLRIFLTLAQTGNFTVAARELGISQPAVSQNIAEIEKEVGAQLFDRRRGEVTLTNKGKRFLEFATQINYWYKAASEEFKSNSADPVWLSGRPKKELRIGIGEGFRCYLVPNGSEDLDIDIEGSASGTSIRVIQKSAGSGDPADGLF